MVRFLKSLWAWKFVQSAGVWRYDENSVTGQRRAIRVNSGGFSPIDLDWLDGNAPWAPHPLINGVPAWRTSAGQRDGRWCQ